MITPNSFSKPRTSSRASMESSPSPSPKRGASISIISGVISTSFNLCIMSCLIFSVRSLPCSIISFLFPPHPLPLPCGERGRVRGLFIPKRIKIIPLIWIFFDMFLKFSDEFLHPFSYHRLPVFSQRGIEINGSLDHASIFSILLHHHEDRKHGCTRCHGEDGTSNGERGFLSEEIKRHRLLRLYSISQHGHNFISAEGIDRIQDGHRRIVFWVNVNIFYPLSLPHLLSEKLRIQIPFVKGEDIESSSLEGKKQSPDLPISEMGRNTDDPFPFPKSLDHIISSHLFLYPL